MKKIRAVLRSLGPGFVTGAADDDPSGIATYSQTGAQFGYGQLWTVLFMLPLMIAIQEASARIGVVTGKGIVAVIKDYYPKGLVYFVVAIIFIANTVNIGADIGAMAAAVHLLIPLPFIILTLLFTGIILSLEIFTSYPVYAKILKWFALALLSYPITVFIIKQPWLEIVKATFLPHIEFTPNFLFIIIGVLGTTISPYMFFWEANEEVEEEKSLHLIKSGTPQITKKFIKNMRTDNAIGMVMSQVATWSIIVVSATVLFKNGVRNITTAADAARALEPLVQTFPNAGFISKCIFTVGIVGLGLLAIPVLSASASYAFAEAFSWKEGLNLKLKQGHGFYGVIIISTLIGLMMNFFGINPIKMLIYTAVLNGVISVPLIFLILRIARDKKIMGENRSGALSQIMLWITFFAMSVATVAMILTFGKQS